MSLIGELKYGKYADNFDAIHPEVLERYGDEGMLVISFRSKPYLQCTILFPDDIDVAIVGDQGHPIRHEAAAVANHELPFQSDDAADIFARALNAAKAEEIIPPQLRMGRRWLPGD